MRYVKSFKSSTTTTSTTLDTFSTPVHYFCITKHFLQYPKSSQNIIDAIDIVDIVGNVDIVDSVNIGGRFASSQALSLARRFSWARRGGGKSGTGRGVGWGGVDPHMFPARKKEAGSCNSFALFTSSSGKLKNQQWFKVVRYNSIQYRLDWMSLSLVSQKYQQYTPKLGEERRNEKGFSG